MEPDSTPPLVRMIQRDIQRVRLRIQRIESPCVLTHLHNALERAVQRVQGHTSHADAVSFSTCPAPLLTDKLRTQPPQRRLRLLRSDFVLPGRPAVRERVAATRPLRRGCSRRAALAHAEEEEDDELDDEEDDEDDVDIDEDDDVSVLSWHMLSSGSPVKAEPVSEADEQLQFDTITAGNVPTMFLGRAYTNGAVNLMALHKMQKLLVRVLCSCVDFVLSLCIATGRLVQHGTDTQGSV